MTRSRKQALENLSEALFEHLTTEGIEASVSVVDERRIVVELLEVPG
jgi:hypothetical protein